MRTLLEERLAGDDLSMMTAVGELGAELGMPVFLAGGSVRDAILSRGLEDWDIVVEGDGVAYAEALAERWGGAVVAHQRFLTATVTLKAGRSFDIATARRETYASPGALPVVEPSAIEEDLWRRDFAINALAVRLSPDGLGEVIDPTGGADDIRRRVVRVLHDRSFWDDATRIVRAIGFERRLAFAMEPETERWLGQATRDGALATVSSERLGEAILPLLREDAGPHVLVRANELGIIARLLGARNPLTPRALHGLREVARGLQQLDEERAGSRAVACLAALLLDDSVEAEQIIGRLHLDRDTARELRSAERYLERWRDGFQPAARPGDLWKQLKEASFGAAIGLWLAAPGDQARQALVRYWRELRETKADISADELKALGYRPGPLFGRALEAAICVKLNDNADHDTQLAAAHKIILEFTCATDG